MAERARVRRPPGVTLALLAVGVLYGLRPLLEAALYRRLEVTTHEALIPGGVKVSVWSGIEGIFGGVMLVLCLLAWLGWPARIRWVLIAAMVALTAVNLVRILQAWGTDPDPIFGGQVQSTLRSALLCQLPLMVVVPLYVVWYLNRAPARAFFRRETGGHPTSAASGVPAAPDTPAAPGISLTKH